MSALWFADDQNTTAVSPTPSFEDRESQDVNGHSDFLVGPRDHRHSAQSEPVTFSTSPISLPDLTHSPISPVSFISTEVQIPFVKGSDDSPSIRTQQPVNIVNETGIVTWSPKCRLEAYGIEDASESVTLNFAKEDLQFPSVEQWLFNDVDTIKAQSTPFNSSLEDGANSRRGGENLRGRSFPWSSWKSPENQSKLLQSISACIQDLPQFVKQFACGIDCDLEVCAAVWDNEWCTAWDDGAKNLLAADLPAFLHGWCLMLVDRAQQTWPGLSDLGRHFNRKHVRTAPTQLAMEYAPASKANSPQSSHSNRITAAAKGMLDNAGKRPRKRKMCDLLSHGEAEWEDAREHLRPCQSGWSVNRVNQVARPVSPFLTDL